MLKNVQHDMKERILSLSFRAFFRVSLMALDDFQ